MYYYCKASATIPIVSIVIQVGAKEIKFDVFLILRRTKQMCLSFIFGGNNITLV